MDLWSIKELFWLKNQNEKKKVIQIRVVIRDGKILLKAVFQIGLVWWGCGFESWDGQG